MSDLATKAQKLLEEGFTEDQIAKILGLEDDNQSQQDYAQQEEAEQYAPVFDENTEYTFDMSDFDEDAVFKMKPDKPNFFKAKQQLKPFKQQFELLSDAEYELNGEKRKLKKLNLRDIMRLTHKVPKWAAYLGYKVPQMLVNEYTGQYRWSETILALFERAFGDYDIDLDRPTDFSLSVIEEMVTLLQLKDKDEPVDYLLSCDPDEVYVAVAKLISYNQTFFLRIWNSLGPIKDLAYSIFGKISRTAKKLNESPSLENPETNLNLTIESE